MNSATRVTPVWQRPFPAAAMVLLLAGASSIPFVYDSPSIRYKFGMDKVFLRTGKILGMIAAVLMLIQLILSARITMLDRVFALNNLYTYHRINAVVIVLLSIFIFNVPVKGSLFLLGVESVLFIITSLALGILISTISATQQTAMMIFYTNLLLEKSILFPFLGSLLLILAFTWSFTE